MEMPPISNDACDLRKEQWHAVVDQRRCHYAMESQALTLSQNGERSVSRREFSAAVALSTYWYLWKHVGTKCRYTDSWISLRFVKRNNLDAVYAV